MIEMKNEITEGIMDRATNDTRKSKHEDIVLTPSDKQRFWKYVQHWTAFVIYGA